MLSRFAAHPPFFRVSSPVHRFHAVGSWNLSKLFNISHAIGISTQRGTPSTACRPRERTCATKKHELRYRTPSNS